MKGVFKLDDFEPLARERLDAAAYAYYAGGAGDEVTLQDNVAAFRRRRLRPRVLVDVSRIDTATRMLGADVPMPVGLAPNAFQALAHPEGEVATARAAAAAGVVMCASTISNRSLEDVAAAAPGPRWFQLYMHKDRGISKMLIERAVAAGYGAIMLTADLPVPGYRERELRHPVKISDQHHFGNFEGMGDAEGQDLLALLDGVINDSLTWDDVEWVRGQSDLPLLVKGILTPEDATLAVERGAAGVVVSNHGGRQLDHAPASIDVLEEIVAQVGDGIEVYLDSGVRRGTDVVIALALGARGVFIGRPYLYALAAGGEEGVTLALQLIAAELRNAMALVGVTSIDQIGPTHLL